MIASLRLVIPKSHHAFAEAAFCRETPVTGTLPDVSDPETPVTRAEFADARDQLNTRIGLVRDALGARIDGVRTEVAGLRTELRAEVAGLRTELREEASSLREEVAGLRTELREEVSSVREEVATLRTEMRAMITDNTNVLRQILRAVEYGNTQRDSKITELERRMDRVESHLGLEPTGTS